MARKKKRRIGGLVPRVVFSTIFVGVVPACVASACGGGTSASTSSTPDAGRDGLFPVGDVAAQCFGGSSDPACQMAVAAVAFQCFDGSTQPGCPQFDAAPDGPDEAADDADAAG